jgi:hypothetical protein
VGGVSCRWRVARRAAVCMLIAVTCLWPVSGVDCGSVVVRGASHSHELIFDLQHVFP